MSAVALALALAATTKVEAGVTKVPSTATHIEVGSAVGPIVLQLEGVPMASLVTMLMRDVMRVPFVIAPEVLADRRLLTLKLVIPRSKIPENVVGFLRKSGMTVQLVGGTVYVSRPGGSVGYQATPVGDTSTPFGSPLSPAPTVGVSSGPVNPGYPPMAVSGAQLAAGAGPVCSTCSSTGPVNLSSGLEVTVGYLPAFRDTGYLAQAIGPMVPGVRFAARADVKANTPELTIDNRDTPDVLLFAGPAEGVALARKLIEAMDRPRPVVSVRAVILSVSETKSRGSALSFLANIAGGKISGGSYPDQAPQPQFLKLAVGGLSAVLSAVREDGRFRVVATPNLSALSGATAMINSGAQVPTIGSVAVTDNGTPVRSVTYRDSGVTLSVRPTVRGELIEIDVREERSTFVKTSTGVADSPTLQKSTATGTVLLRSGESVILAGLSEVSDGNTRAGLFGGLLGVRTHDKSSSELVVMLQADVVDLVDVPRGSWIEFDTKKPRAKLPAPVLGVDGPEPAADRQTPAIDNTK